MTSLSRLNFNHGEHVSPSTTSKFRRVLSRLAWLLLLPAMLFSAAASQAQTVSADFGYRSGSTPAIPSGAFGLNGTGVDVTDSGTVSQLTSAGLTGTRIWIDLSQIYATPTPNFKILDAQLKNVANLGLRPLGVMYHTPPSLGSQSCSMPSNVTQWGQMAASVVAHVDQTHPGLIQDYAIWNEPDSNVSLCVPASQALNDYLSIYAAAAPKMKAQAAADGQTIRVGGPALSSQNNVSTWIPAFLSGATAPYVDFVSFHIYPTGQTEIDNRMNWNTLYSKTQSAMTSYYNHVEALVRKGSQPNAAKTPIYVTELNANWAYAVDGLRNDPTYGPLWNSVAITDLLNTVYNGAKAGPSKIFYFNSAGKYFCIVGQWDGQMDCALGNEPYPQFYTYKLFASPQYLNLQSGAHMAASVSPLGTNSGLAAAAFYTNTADNVVIVNPTSTDYNSVSLTVLNTGFTSATGTSYLLNSSNRQISTESVALSPTSGGYKATVAVPAYSTVAISLTGSASSGSAPSPSPSPSAPTTAVLNVTPASGTAPLVVTIDSAPSEGNIVGRTTDFGDGTWVNMTPTTTHTYTKPGTYTVQLTVKDLSGQVKTASSIVTVKAAPSTVTSAVLHVTPTSGTGPLTITADSSASTGNIVGRTIDFGDGTWVNSTPTASHTYQKAGSYTVQLTVKDQSGTVKSASSVVTVQAAQGGYYGPSVEPGPIPQPSATKAVLTVTPQSGTHALQITVDSSASTGNIVGRTINFGDGTWVNWTPTATHTYQKAGSYTVQLTVKDQSGKADTASSVVTVK